VDLNSSGALSVRTALKQTEQPANGGQGLHFLDVTIRDRAPSNNFRVVYRIPSPT